jgi:membrane protease YdiL (CAAX protease family)
MAHPIGYGVQKAMRERRRAAPGPPPGPARSWVYFVLLTAGLSWMTAILIGAPRADLLGASIHYAATMGWTPLVGAWLARWARDVDPPPRSPIRVAELGLALAVAAGLAAAAIGVAWLAGQTLDLAAVPSGHVAAAVPILCVQALTEEYGWRGYPLDCAIERWGERAGQAIHAAAWGLWYLPLVLLVSAQPSAALADAAGLAMACAVLGIVLGWLRRRSGGVLAPAVVNATLTILAGLALAGSTLSSG